MAQQKDTGDGLMSHRDRNYSVMAPDSQPLGISLVRHYHHTNHLDKHFHSPTKYTFKGFKEKETRGWQTNQFGVFNYSCETVCQSR